MSLLRGAGLLAWVWALLAAVPLVGLHWVEPADPFVCLMVGACLLMAWPRLRLGGPSGAPGPVAGAFAAADVAPAAAAALVVAQGEVLLGTPGLWVGLAAVAVSGFLGATLGASRHGGRRAAYGSILLVLGGAFVSRVGLGSLPGAAAPPAVETGGPGAVGSSRQGAELLPVRVRLQGPLGEAWIQMEGRAPLRIMGPLFAGESKACEGWLLGDPGPEFQTPESLSVRVVPGDDPDPEGSPFEPLGVDPRVHVDFLTPGAQADATVSPGVLAALGGRGRPAPPRPRDGVPWRPLLALTAGLVGTRALRSAAARGSSAQSVPAVAAALALSGALAWTLLGGWWSSPGGHPPGAGVRIVEGQRLSDGSVAWWQFDRLPGGVPFPVGAELPSIRPVGGPPPRSTTVTLEADTAAVGGEDVILEIDAPLNPGLRLLMPGVNTWGPLDAVWERPPGAATFQWRGAWALGEALAAPGEPRETPSEPLPAWASQGVGQGRAILLARAAPGTFPGEAVQGTVEGAPGVTWIRLVDFQ